MRAFMTLVRYELRRHGSAVTGACLMLVPLPFIHRLMEGNWGYWSGDWKVGGSLFAQFIIAPALAAGLALSGWAEERAAGTLGWLYARPIPAGVVFAARVAAVVGGLAVFLAIALASHLREPSQLLVIPEMVITKRWLGLVPLGGGHWLALIALIVAGGLLASSLAGSTGGAVRGFLFGGVVVALLSFSLWRAVLPAAARWRIELLAQIHVAQLLLWAMAAACGAWAAVGRAALDRSRVRRAALAAAGPALAGCLLVGLLAVHPVFFGHLAPLGVRAVGDSVELRLIRSAAMNRRSAVIRLWLRTGRTVTIQHTTHMAIQDVFVNPTSGAALVKRIYEVGPDPWSMVEPSGETYDLAFPPEMSWPLGLQPFGWSPGGSRFAWGSRSGSKLVLLEPDASIRRLDVALEGTWRASWLDETHLLIGPWPDRLWGDFWGPPPRTVDGWSIIDVRRAEHVGPLRHRGGQTILFPALMAAPYSRPWTETPPRWKGLPLAVFEGLAIIERELTRDSVTGRGRRRRQRHSVASREVTRLLATVDPKTRRVDTLLPVFNAPRLRMAGLGNIDDGRLVWLRPTDAEGRKVEAVVLEEPLSESESSCAFDLQPDTELLRWRGSAGGWVVWEEGQRLSFDPHPESYRHLPLGSGLVTRLHACHIDSGETRTFEDPGPLGLIAVGEGILLTPEGRVPLENLEPLEGSGYDR